LLGFAKKRAQALKPAVSSVPSAAPVRLAPALASSKRNGL